MTTVTNVHKPTAKMLLGDALRYTRSNFKIFFIFGGILILAPKLIRILLLWSQDDPELFGLGALEWPVYFVGVILNAIFAYNVHRFVLCGQRTFSFALGKTFWLFFAAVLIIALVFLIPHEIIENYSAADRLYGSAGEIQFVSMVSWFIIVLGVQTMVSILILALFARFLTIPPHIAAQGKIAWGANLAIGRALYWQIVLGLLFLHVFLNLYAFLVGMGLWPIQESFMSVEDDHYALVSLTLREVFFAPISFFSVLLGATFTSAALIRGSEYLGYPDPRVEGVSA